MEAFEAELLACVRDRPAGEPIAAAFARFVLKPRGFLAAQDGDSARFLIGTHQSLTEFVRRHLAEGSVDHVALAREVWARGREAMDLLEQGLAGYGARPAMGQPGSAGTGADGEVFPPGD
jgi:hypothetical protein